MEKRPMSTSEESFAYTPGLRVTPLTYIRKIRSLPVKGQILVKVGDRVEFDTIVARCYLEGMPQILKVAELLDVDPEEVPRYLLKKKGDPVKKGEIIARLRAAFGLINKTVLSPIDGYMEDINEITGNITIREPQRPVEVAAYIRGKIDEVIPQEAAIVGSWAAYLQGIIGFSGERFGELRVAVSKPEDTLTQDNILESDHGKILVGGSFVTLEALEKARKIGLKGIISGGANIEDLEKLIGARMGVAITGREELGFTLILTEGFGKLPISDRAFKILKDNEGKIAAINGATQVRAGVLRPEIIIPKDVSEKMKIEDESLEEGKMRPGSIIRIIRYPYFGKLGRVVRLPVDLMRIETESLVRVVEVELTDGTRVMVPRADVEIVAE
jgi:hypothetical protein